MGFNNPSWSWSELEATLSDRPSNRTAGRDGRAPGSSSWNSGGDGPAWSRKRQPFEAPPDLTRSADAPTTPYAELHCHSNFSFLDGASHPEELATEAARLGLDALALTDHDGFYGVVRFAEAAKAVGLPTVFGTEIGLSGHRGSVVRSERDTDRQIDTGMVPDSHAPDPSGTHLLVLADGPTGYARLSRTLSAGHLAGEKGAPQFAFADVADTVAGHAWVLTGCRKGAVPAALMADGPAAARRELLRLVDAFGRDRVLVELWDHGDPLDSARNDALAEIAHRERVECVATN
ncbi:MAG TPA: PHP domain-containing protein, partial [Ilumatobacteraceae bacterium]|nr:PHP domain-containing protein [Ilumatobacteraceae bacterium]